MVPRWKKLSLRVFITVHKQELECPPKHKSSHRTEHSNDAIHNDSIVNSQEALVTRMLQLLRISASARVVHWTPPKDHLLLDETAMDETYLECANQMVLEHSADTAVTFLYLPEPPKPTPTQQPPHSFASSSSPSRFLAALNTLTTNWPPTLMVRGVSPVMSITL